VFDSVIQLKKMNKLIESWIEIIGCDKLLSSIGPSQYKWMFPGESYKGFEAGFGNIDECARNGLFPSLQGLLPGLVWAILFGVARLVLYRLVFVPLAYYSMNLKDATFSKIDDIDRAFATNMAAKTLIAPVHQEVVDFCSKNSSSGYTILSVKKYLSNRRRSIRQQNKITKFAEALWRFIFYFSFCIIGYQTLFVPDTSEWLLDTKKFWIGWPNQRFTDAIKFYYHIELGCYIHQLMWTEVARSDAVEMMVHHLTTILLIALSYLTGFMRVGVSIMLLHDTADIWLESAKVFNYSGKVKAHALSRTICDVFFGMFAIMFFVTRLVLYPRFILYSVLVEAREVFGQVWVGFWVFAGLLTVLQCLHVFWFYLIGKMIVKLVIDKKVEKDVRESDDEDSDDEDDAPRGGEERSPERNSADSKKMQ
jgi:hypothetical protein